MDIQQNGTRPSSLGPAENFTGHARRDPVHKAVAPSHLTAGLVTFDAGARTVWHTHPVGQLLVITAGCGRVGTWDGPVTEVKAGDTIWFAPMEKHWHGAGPTTGMTHLAVLEEENGVGVTWLEPVTPAQYLGEA